MSLKRRMLLSSLFMSVLAACTGGTREVPGDEPNPRLAMLINESLERHLRSMRTDSMPAYLPGAAERARAWLRQIRSASTSCRYGPGNRSRYNTFQYEVELVDGSRISDIKGHRRCNYDSALPLITQVDFVDGRAVRARSDGRERKWPVDATRPDIDAFTLALLREDQRRHAALYRPSTSAEQIEQQWKP